MLNSIQVNSYKKLNKVIAHLKRQKRGFSYDTFWDYNSKFYILYYVPREFNPEYCNRRCNVI